MIKQYDFFTKIANSSLLSILLLVFSLLVSYSVEANTKLDQGLFYSARSGDYKNVVNLLKRGAKINHRNHRGESPLHAAASTGQFAITRLLLSKKADVLALTQDDWTPLHHAVRFGHLRVAILLLNNKAPLYVRTHEGKTVFDLARMSKNKRMVSMLKAYSKKMR